MQLQTVRRLSVAVLQFMHQLDTATEMSLGFYRFSRNFLQSLSCTSKSAPAQK